MTLSPTKLTRGGLHNDLVNPLLTDFYQITMAYAYWSSGKRDTNAVFDLFFRKCPFGGEFAIFAGLQDCLDFVENFRYTQEDIEYLRTTLPNAKDEFFDYLAGLTAKDITVHAFKEGTLAFPKEPLMRVEGPLPIVQLVETTFLNLVNFASLVATNAARFRMAAGPQAKLLEFGLRRAQGPDGGLSASRYCYIGGFDATSNVLAGKLYGIPISGTHAHAFVSSFKSMDELATRELARSDGDMCADFPALVLTKQALVKEAWPENLLNRHLNANEKELAAFTAYAIAFPTAFLALIDTYDVLNSGCPNFLIVALALHDLGHVAKGVRLDSGDLAYQSKVCRSVFDWAADRFNAPSLKEAIVVASNDINEDTLHSLETQGHKINSYGVGTHLVTCQAQPALGCVYKLVEADGSPCIKLSADVQKVTMPGKKLAFRLYGQDDAPICDILTQEKGDIVPKVGESILCRHPFQEQKRAMVRPMRVEQLYDVFWSDGKKQQILPSIHDLRQRVRDQMASLRMDHKRTLNPTPYKVSVTNNLYSFIHDLWLENAPVGELS